MDPDKISKLTTFIEENLRATINSGMKFIDPKHYKNKLSSRQNHVAFGRRGSGKSSLVSSLKNGENHFFIYINLEDYKDISFPNIMLHVLRSSFDQILKESKRLSPWNNFSFRVIWFRWKLKKKVKIIEKLLEKPDQQEIALRTRDANAKKGNLGIKTDLIGVGGERNSEQEREVSTQYSENKLQDLQLTLVKYKEWFDQASQVHKSLPIYLVLDDLYFLKKEIQPYFVDFFHRLSKGTNLFIKMATIKHRSLLYLQDGDTYIGTEIGHDIYDIDLDYTLDKFDDLKQFMSSLLEHSILESNSELAFNELFAGDSFSQLCLASGGVPRDFLSLFVKVANANLVRGDKINKISVTDCAINSINNKLSSIGQDSEGESAVLEVYLQEVRDYVYTKNKTNAFLVAKQDLEKFKQGRQALRELVDMRLLHIIDSNTSCAPSDGRRYEAYIIDVGLFENSRPMHFKQIEPGATDTHGRSDSMRAAPKLNLELLQSQITEAFQGKELVETLDLANLN